MAVAWLALVAFAAPAAAHEGEEKVPARTQVQRADPILRVQPERIDLAADRIGEAAGGLPDPRPRVGRSA